MLLDFIHVLDVTLGCFCLPACFQGRSLSCGSTTPIVHDEGCLRVFLLDSTQASYSIGLRGGQKQPESFEPLGRYKVLL